MKLDKQIYKTFELKKVPVSHANATNESNLAYIGYPELFQISFFLTCVGLANWDRRRVVEFPGVCCVCGTSASALLTIYQANDSFFRRKKNVVLDKVPHCGAHATKAVPQLVVTADVWTENVIQISLIGLNESFLAEALRLNQVGDVVPPWIAFPEYNTVSGGWRQGNGECWWQEVWLPFWEALPANEKRRYLTHHEAEDEWINRLDQL